MVRKGFRRSSTPRPRLVVAALALALSAAGLGTATPALAAAAAPTVRTAAATPKVKPRPATKVVAPVTAKAATPATPASAKPADPGLRTAPHRAATTTPSTSTPLALTRARTARVTPQTAPLTRSGTHLAVASPTSTPSTPSPTRPATVITSEATGVAKTQATTAASGTGFTSLSISPDLNCEGDVAAFSSHPSQFYGNTACATFLFVDGNLYGPGAIPAGRTGTRWTPVSQTTTGSGTQGDPTTIVTVVTAGSTGVQLTQTDTLVTGSPLWTTRVDIANPNGASVTRLTTARDCYVAQSDLGIGQADTGTKSTFCEGNAAALGLTPGTAGATYYEAGYSQVWALATSDADLPNSADQSYIDNGQALSWALSGTSSSHTWKSILVPGPTPTESGSSPNPSVPPTGCSSAQPVNCATGDFWHTFTDASVSARGLPLSVQRTYDLVNSGVTGAFGYGWSSSLDLALTQTSSTEMTLTQENGSLLPFTLTDGAWTSAAYVTAGLTQTSTGWLVTRRDTALSYLFDTSLRLTSIQDASGESLTVGRNAAGQVTSLGQQGAGTISLTWSGGHVASVTDAVGTRTTYSYNASGELTGVTLPSGGTWAFTYAAGHLLTTMTDPAGRQTINTFDAQDRVISQVQPSGGTVTYDFAGDPASTDGGTTTQTDERGVVTTYHFSQMLMLQRTTSGGGTTRSTGYNYDLVTLGLSRVSDDDVTRSSGYDSQGRLTSTTDSRGYTTTRTYDGDSRRIATVVSPAGRTTTNAYDSLGRMTSTTDGVTTRTFSYDDPAHPSDVTSSTQGDRVTTFTHDALGNVTLSKVTSPRGSVVQTAGTYDAAGRVLCTVTPAAYAAGTRCAATGHSTGTTTSTYDAAGNALTTTDPAGGVTTKTYDVSGRLLSSRDASGSLTTLAYDASDAVSSSTRAAGTAQAQTSTTTSNVPAGEQGCPTDFGTVTCTVDTDGSKVTVTGYDASGDVVSTVRPGGSVEGMYRTAGLVRQVVREDGSSLYLGYAGDLLTQTSGSGGGGGGGNPTVTTSRATPHTTATPHAAASAAASTTTPTPPVSFAYDADGQRTVMDDGTGETTWEYDASGALVAETTPQGTVRATRNATGDLATLTYPDGSAVQRTYDADGRVVAVTDWSGRTTQVAVTDDGSITGTTLPNGRSITSTYDANGSLSSVAVPGTGIGLTYQRDGLQRVTSETATGLPGPASTTLAYDALGQLASVNGVTTASDASGNPTTVAGVTQTFDDALALATHSVGADQLTYTTDAFGERSAQQLPNGTRSLFTYDDSSRLTSEVGVSGPAVTAISATAGPSTGGTSVVVTGVNFPVGAVVWFGDTAATTTRQSATRLTATAPAGSGAVPVTVLAAVGRSTPTASTTFTYQGPAVTGLSLHTGTVAGGQQVTVTGLNLGGATAVAFGSTPATFTAVSPTSLTVTTPAATGTQHLTVTTSQGTSTPTAADSFAFSAVPVVSTVAPAAGPPGTMVTLTGLNLGTATSVAFGATAGTGVQVLSATSVRVKAPAGSGTVDLTVTSPDGTSTTSTTDQFTYAAGPRVLSLAPATAKATGGSKVTVKGTGFTAASTVTIGGVSATSTFVSATALSVTVPADATGPTAYVVVTTGAASSPALPGATLTYLRPTVTALSVATGPTVGGQVVTLTGSRLTGVKSVLFGTKKGVLGAVTPTSVAVTAPKGTGIVDVHVTTAEGTSLSTPADTYTYTGKALVTGVTTDIGTGLVSPRGDTSVTLTGFNLTNVSTVTFGAASGTVTATTPTSVTVTAPAGTVASVVDVKAKVGATGAVLLGSTKVVYAQRDDRWTYDGLGRAVGLSSADGTTTPTIWDPFASQPTPLVHGSWRLVTAAGSIPVEQVDATDKPFYPVLDGRGAPRAILNSSGAVVSTFSYGPYGQTLTSTGTVKPAIGFGGGLVLPSGLIRLGQRVLDPTTGTFLTVDPATALTGTPYAYTSGDPYNSVDRSGLWPTIVIGAIIGAVVGTVVSTVSYAVSPGQHDLRGYLGAAAGGAVSGAVTGACLGTGVGLLASAACGAAGGAAGSITNQLISTGTVDWGGVAVEAGFGAVVGGVGGLVAKKLGLELTQGQIRSWSNLRNSDKWLPGRIRTNYWQNSWIGGLIDGPRNIIASYLKCYG